MKSQMTNQLLQRKFTGGGIGQYLRITKGGVIPGF